MSVGQSARGPAHRGRLMCLALAGAFLLLYGFTLAPTVLSGDGASFQTRAVQPGFWFAARGYPVYMLVAKAFAHLPVGDVAYRVSLVSLVFGVLGVWMMGRLVLTLTGSATGAAFAAVALGLSHLFWVHAVRAEIWTMQIALMVGIMWALMSWGPSRPLPLVGLGMLVPLALFHHRITLVTMPVVVWMLFAKRGLLQRQRSAALPAAAIGLLLLSLLVAWGYLSEWRHQGLREALTAWLFLAPQFAPRARVSLHMLGFGLGTLVGVFGYSFLGPALGVGFVGVLRGHRLVGPQNAWFLTLALVANVCVAAFVSAQRGLTHYTPAIAIWAAYCGIGVAYLERQWPAWATSLMMPTQAILVVMLYAFAPAHLAPRLQRFTQGRSPEEIAYWATPWASYAHQFRAHGKAALSALPSRSTVLANYGLYATLRYLQRVEGMRPDVTLLFPTPADISLWRRLLATGGGPAFVERSLRRTYAPRDCVSTCIDDFCQLLCVNQGSPTGR